MAINKHLVSDPTCNTRTPMVVSFLVYWSMVAASDGTPSYTASEGGKLRCEYDASSPTYIPYADLTEADVLGWVYASLVEGEETPDEAKLAYRS